MKDDHIGYIALGLVLGAAALLILWVRGAFDPEAEVAPSGPITPLTADAVEVDMAKVVLGRRLYHDGILSGDGSLSCASCHAVQEGGAEHRPTSFGIRSQVGPINAPTVLNSHFNFRQFWDGRAADLEEQAGGPVENPIEMGASFEVVVERIEQDPWYAERFAEVYPEEGISRTTITNAIAEYERSLITPAPFDAWLQGEAEAIDEPARRGYETFVSVGCPTCHNGVNVGGNSYQRLGLVRNYFERRGTELTEADMGRMNVTGDEAHRHQFKVPTLRNVALTAPYFHDGSESELSGAVRTMGAVQLGLDLNDEQVDDIVAFLNSLTGELPEHATLPEDETPPERFYEPADNFDVRVSKTVDASGATQIGLAGSVDAESREIWIGAVRDHLGEPNVEAFAAGEIDHTPPEDLQSVLGQFLPSLRGLGRLSCEFDFADGDRPTVRVEGEGDEAALAAARSAVDSLPEPFASAEDPIFLDSTSADECDARLLEAQGEFGTLRFVTAEYQLSDENEAVLSRIAEAIRACPLDARVLIDGHTDSVGEPGDNLRLSRRRAEAVRDALVAEGIGSERLRATGYGDRRPSESNDSLEGRAANRRIHIHLARVE